MTSGDNIQGDKVGGDTVAGDKVLGDQWNINYYQPATTRLTASSNATERRCSRR